MNKTYVIQWKSRVNGRMGKGTKQFDREEADRLVEELNREYPQIEHQTLEVLSTAETVPLSAGKAENNERQDTDSNDPMQALAA